MGTPKFRIVGMGRTPYMKNSKKIYIGIDPGANGALCLFEPLMNNLKFIDFKTGMKFSFLSEKVSELLADVRGEVKACLEQVYSTPLMGKKALFSFGKNIQLWYDILDYHAIPFFEVRPQIWMRSFIPLGKGREGIKTKSLLLNVALKLAPLNASSFFTKRGRYLDGRGDAFLMAYYIYQKDKKI